LGAAFGRDVSVVHVEVASIGPDEVVVTFTTPPDVRVTTRVGERAVVTTGPYHVARVGDLEPATEYAVEVGSGAPGEGSSMIVQTLARPSGALLATIATVNDVHFGEVECGHLGAPHEDIGPIFRSGPGEPPYPETMSRAAIEEISSLAPDAVIAKGDLTDRGADEEYAAFLASYGAFGDRLAHVRGNHDAVANPTLALEGAPYAIELTGVVLAVLDTVIPGADTGRVTWDQLGWLDDLADEATVPILVFGHHNIWNLDAPEREASYFGINPDDSDALAEIVRRHENVVGYFAGHTHRNRVRRFASARSVPFVEVACTKDYPGAWAEYRVFEGGYTQVVRRIAAPEAMAWTERTRQMFAGLYQEYALGPIGHRCFSERF
jgi:predicted phosphodiesterase